MRDEEEFRGAVSRINTALYKASIRRAEHLGIDDRVAYANAYDPVGPSDDVVAQEYIDGLDMTCTVIQIGQACIDLTPFIYKTKEVVIR
jgi:hypothetical protein